MKTTRKPKRHRLSRKKDSRLEKGVKVVTRSTRWGNPFKIDGKTSREKSVKLYEAMLKRMTTSERDDFLSDLRGKDLACWCPLDVACHADVLLKWANR